MLPATVNPGVYLCTSTISFPPNAYFQVGTPASPANGGVVEIYVIPSSGTADVNLDNSWVNVSPAGVEGDPTKLRVYLAGAGNVNPGNGSHAATFVGIMYAPSSNMTSNGCKADWRGALIFRTATCNGGPHLSVRYDTRVAALSQSNWTVRDYREIPSGQVVLP